MEPGMLTCFILQDEMELVRLLQRLRGNHDLVVQHLVEFGAHWATQQHLRLNTDEGGFNCRSLSSGKTLPVPVYHVSERALLYLQGFVNTP